MTIGINKEALEEIALGFDRQNMEYACVVRSIISDCRELDPWLPIDENTPKDRRLILYISDNKSIFIGRFNRSTCEWDLDGVLRSVIPTHYKELPEDPKV